MSEREIKTKITFIEYLWWKLVPGTTIKVKWPRKEWLVLQDDGDGGRIDTLTDDPNDHYLPWLEKNVGKQGIDWNWRIQVGRSFYTPGYEDQDQESDKVVIKFRKGKGKWASVAGLLWS